MAEQQYSPASSLLGCVMARETLGQAVQVTPFILFHTFGSLFAQAITLQPVIT